MREYVSDWICAIDQKNDLVLVTSKYFISWAFDTTSYNIKAQDVIISLGIKHFINEEFSFTQSEMDFVFFNKQEIIKSAHLLISAIFLFK